jgi:thioredoxin-related protein
MASDREIADRLYLIFRRIDGYNRPFPFHPIGCLILLWLLLLGGLHEAFHKPHVPAPAPEPVVERPAGMNTLVICREWYSPAWMQMLKVLDDPSVREEFDGFLLVNHVNDPKANKKYKVRTLPTFLFVDPDGNELGRIEGVVSAREFADWLRESKSAERVQPPVGEKPVLLIFTDSSSRACLSLKKSSEDPRVQAQFNRFTVIRYVDDYQAAHQYRVEDYPALIVKDMAGTEIGRHEGAMSADKLASWLKGF